MLSGLSGAGAEAMFLAATMTTTVAAPLGNVRAPLTCSRGSGNAQFIATVAVPSSAARASMYAVRIDGVPSEKISHFGLNYIHDQATDYAIPPGATYVAGSARIIPGTGTPNVSASAQVTYEAGLVRLLLPAHVPSGSTYTPPSIEFRLEAAAPAGTSLQLAFSQYRVTANAFLVGDVHATCESVPKRYTIGTTLVTAAPAP